MRLMLIFSCFVLNAINVIAHPREDNFFMGEISLVFNNNDNYETCIILHQKSLLTQHQMIPQSLSLTINRSFCLTLIRDLINGGTFNGLRFMTKNLSSDDITYYTAELTRALISITQSSLLLEPLTGSGETDSMIVNFTLDDLRYLQKTLENSDLIVNYPHYELDLSDPVVLADVSQVLLKACTKNDQIILPPLIDIINLITEIAERFRDHIT